MYCRSELKSKHIAVFFSGPSRFTDTRFTDNTKSVGIHIWGLAPITKSVGVHIWGPAPNKKSVWIHIWGKIYVYCDENYGVRV